MARQVEHGLLRWPGATAASKATVRRLIEKDVLEHHFYFNSIGLHDHLNHHLAAAYDLGASASLLEKISADHLPFQRGLHIDQNKEPARIHDGNWKEHLGESAAYAAYLGFFLEKLKSSTIKKVVEEHVFDDDANDAKARMLARLPSSLLHPMIVLGYGIEFSSDALTAQGLAGVAIGNERVAIFPTEWPSRQHSQVNGQTTVSKLPLFGVLKELLDSDILAPPQPYDPKLLMSNRIAKAVENGGAEEIDRIASLWDIDANGNDEHFDLKIQECFWLATCVLGGAGKRGRRFRADFFLAHGLTSCLFLPSYVKLLSKKSDKVAVLVTWVRMTLATILGRGRPKLDAWLLMSLTATPRPPTANAKPIEPGPRAIGDPLSDDNPWTDIIKFGMLASDWHLLKALRTLIYADRMYGTTSKGCIPGAEYIAGLDQIDGTVFVRVAGAIMAIMGWNSVKTGDGGWDRSCLGYDEAFKDDEIVTFDENLLDDRLRAILKARDQSSFENISKQ